MELSCPNNGDRCKYKHCLPPGYKLKRDGGKADVEIEKVDIQKRQMMKGTSSFPKTEAVTILSCRPLVTYQVFLKWKEDRKKRKQLDAKKKKDDDEKKNKQKCNSRQEKNFSIMTALSSWTMRRQLLSMRRRKSSKKRRNNKSKNTSTEKMTKKRRSWKRRKP